ncbi:DUF2316 family protein [Lacticaseibacillus jixianensis]|uniref:DUF2316 family protein n=1 Tax=Lacticaseibacillus jixianensis TaxID=2486012 RepID=A0ABW4BA57_9LACO|nr:DUF2316 family protein [Lacticaseibacillus jixianensis]
MSLTLSQQRATKEEFKQNLALSGLDIQTIAAALGTSKPMIEADLQLRPARLEDPWILRNYLIEQIQTQGKQPVPFTALKGDYHQYWFLDGERIDRGLID